LLGDVGFGVPAIGLAGSGLGAGGTGCAILAREDPGKRKLNGACAGEKIGNGYGT
jgi:hypothetical protein